MQQNATAAGALPLDPTGELTSALPKPLTGFKGEEGRRWSGSEGSGRERNKRARKEGRRGTGEEQGRSDEGYMGIYPQNQSK